MTKLAVSIPEAAQMLGIGRSSLYALFREQKLTPRKSGKRTLVLVDELRQYAESLPAGVNRRAISP
ncbi:helix-turn-helix domain-containing protein [Pseudaminobacter sp. 19-2017]|uniref:Helix-turn-helix domain-containing protein n=1 Tax=Pseudaminobacter soli (ex Zhang et al. 2022) TaxID=2831468 RepID=A0A942IBR5_9HYPH|nr:helix-turn-helix domain-containing protein [Pseudaminobacter soli]